MEKKAKLTLKLDPNDLTQVKKGEHVSPGDTLISFKESDAQEFNLAEILKIDPKQLKKYVTVKDGTHVAEGAVIAQKGGVLQKQLVRSPASGIFKITDEKKGLIAITQHEKKETVISWFNGTVLEVTPDKIIFELSGVVISGKSGRGKPVSGNLLFVEETMDILTMPIDLEKRILATGVISPDIAAKADALGVTALIATEMAVPPFELPYLVVPEISQLKHHQGKTIIVYGDENQLLVVDDTKKTSHK